MSNWNLHHVLVFIWCICMRNIPLRLMLIINWLLKKLFSAKAFLDLCYNWKTTNCTKIHLTCLCFMNAILALCSHVTSSIMEIVWNFLLYHLNLNTRFIHQGSIYMVSFLTYQIEQYHIKTFLEYKHGLYVYIFPRESNTLKIEAKHQSTNKSSSGWLYFSA